MDNSNCNMGKASSSTILTSLDEITEHAKLGHLKTEVAGVVVNCPFVET